MKSLIFITSLLMLSAQSAYAGYNETDVTNDTTTKNASVNAEVEVREFLLLGSVDNMELSFSSGASGDSLEGAGGSVYTGTGTVSLDTNIAATVTLANATLTHVDAGQTTRNTIAAAISFSDGSGNSKTFNPDGETAFSEGFTLTATLAAGEDGATGTQRAGTYQGTATVVAAPAVGS